MATRRGVKIVKWEHQFNCLGCLVWFYPQRSNQLHVFESQDEQPPEIPTEFGCSAVRLGLWIPVPAAAKSLRLHGSSRGSKVEG